LNFLTKEQVDLLDYKECKRQLKLLEQSYPFDTPIEQVDQIIWTYADDATNALLYLEDRIRLYEDPRISSMNPEEELEDEE
jgi:hypothetical protein